ncbi:MAG: ABC transporter permease [Bacteroidetes bacterium]|nr:ABC transporter permease [Bacteroidota bacterium]
MNKQAGKSPGYYVRQRFLRNKPAVWCSVFIILCVFISVSGSLFLPDKSPDANEQMVEIAAKKPGFSVLLLRIKDNIPSPQNSIFNTILSGRKSEFTELPIQDYFFRSDSMYVTPFGRKKSDKTQERFLLADVYDAINPDKPNYVFSQNKMSYTDVNNNKKEIGLNELQSKIKKENINNKTYLLGTDRYGRDMLSRMLLGTRISLSVGLIAVILSLIIGITIGAIAGFFGGVIDSILMWLVSVVWSIPTLLLVIAMSLVLGRGFWQVFIAVGLTMWVEVARLVRGQILSIKEYEYVNAGKALGFGNSRLIIKHIIPAITGPVIVISAANFASAILLESGLSFLGVGIQPPAPSWGMMLNDHFGYIVLDTAYLAFLPGFAIMFMVLAFNFLGNGLRDAYDVKGG